MCWMGVKMGSIFFFSENLAGVGPFSHSATMRSCWVVSALVGVALSAGWRCLWMVMCGMVSVVVLCIGGGVLASCVIVGVGEMEPGGVEFGALVVLVGGSQMLANGVHRAAVLVCSVGDVEVVCGVFAWQGTEVEAALA
eukprot:TRINITY_DN60770_c0_g2_i1.p1 TRINITY_DN60770_c0_g2~~TRINITY_DN60770_c0_g2_i1.p1  ORF type:complete len:139 (+),score=5.06 TRINITY_DN60770_c0_g2_i1:685-1101(+)